MLGTTLACLNTGVRVTYAMAKDKEMPGILGLLHGRFATPHGGILVLTVISALIGVYCATPYNVDNITQITLASNTGTFLVYGMSCLIAVVAFAKRHDKHLLKHTVVPRLGALMNLAELFGVVYLAITAGGAGSKDAYKALGDCRPVDRGRRHLGGRQPQQAPRQAGARPSRGLPKTEASRWSPSEPFRQPS